MANQRDYGQSFTSYGWSVCIWVLVVSFQYGYHISVLNQIKDVLTCKDLGIDLVLLSYYPTILPTCIPMSDFTFSVVTSIFTLGGLTGSVAANFVLDRWGRKSTTRVSAVFVAAGAGLMGISGGVTTLGFGRFLVGIGSGLGLCVGPIYLSEIAPTKISGNVGVLTQLAIVIGIMITQSMGLRLATPTQWRLVILFSFALSVVQFLASVLIVESPAWLGDKGLNDDRKLVLRKLWGVANQSESSTGDENPLLDESEQRRENPHVAAINVPQLLKAPGLRRPLLIVCLGMTAQQLSGINAVLYYSNDILSNSLPEWGPYVSLGITIVNVLMTFPPIILIERMGRKQLLTISAVGLLASLVAVGYGLNSGMVTLSSVAILTFVMSFAIGLGPVPFVIIPEVSPFHAVSALSSVALSLNWIANFVVGLVFLPLRNLLSGGDPKKDGRVFYVFVIVLGSSMVALLRLYKR